MASVLTFTTILIVVVTSVNSEQTNFLRYSNYLQKAIPNHWQHDKEDLGGRLDTVARWHKVEDVEAPLPPLRQQQEAVWQGWSKRSRLAAMEGARNNDLQKVRRRMLEQKLKLQNLRPKRSVTEMKPENVEKVSEIQSEPNKRTKREAVRESPSQPKAVGQFLEHPDTNTQYQEKVNEKRDKRQILYLIQERPAQIYFKAPRTTRNPFIRETNIQDYEIEKPDNLVQRPVPLPASAEEIDTDSYMISETSDLEYESQYTISMSDSEDWENYPLTTPSGPNPGWGLSTLADIYQKPNRPQGHLNLQSKPHPRIRLHQQVLAMTRVKRSPKQRKRKIGAYKEKLKQRRKIKEMKRKRRIIRNSKEDKEVKEDLKDDKLVEELLQKAVKPRRTSYKQDKVSQEVLWSNDTHRIVEDKGATFDWFNKTHYRIYKDNVTDDWYNKDHVLVYDEDYAENLTRKWKVEEAKAEVEPEEDEDYTEEYDEDFTREEEEEMRKTMGKKRKPTKDPKVVGKKSLKGRKKLFQLLMEKQEVEPIKVKDEQPKEKKGLKKKTVKDVKKTGVDASKTEEEEEKRIKGKKVKEKKTLKKKTPKEKIKSDEEISQEKFETDKKGKIKKDLKKKKVKDKKKPKEIQSQEEIEQEKITGKKDKGKKESKKKNVIGKKLDEKESKEEVEKGKKDKGKKETKKKNVKGVKKPNTEESGEETGKERTTGKRKKVTKKKTDEEEKEKVKPIISKYQEKLKKKEAMKDLKKSEEDESGLGWEDQIDNDEDD